MKSLRTKFSVGLFVIIGMSIIIIAVLWLGMSPYLKEGTKYAAYFNESVQGLSQDAAVKYRGVDVGRVNKIGVAPDGRLVEIIFTVSKKLQNTENLVAQVKSVGITGIMFVELERTQPGKKVKKPEYDFTTEYPVISTKPSDMKQLLTDVYEIISRIKNIDMEGISKRLIDVTENMNRSIKDAEIEKISSGLQQTIEKTNRILDVEKWHELRISANKTINNLNRLTTETRQSMNRIDTSFSDSAAHFNQALDQVNEGARTVEQVFGSISQSLDAATIRTADYDRRLMEILKELETATNELNRLIEQLNRQPSRLIYGGPLPEKKIAPEKN